MSSVASDLACSYNDELKTQLRTLWHKFPADYETSRANLFYPGQVLADRFFVLDRAGRGGMGEVYRARDLRLDRIVALKVVSSRAAADRPHLRQRLEEEARAVSRLSHPRICSLYDLYFENGSPLLVMEYLEGETLAARIAREPISLPSIIEIGSQILEALSYAHNRGLIHRDLKPSNVMLTPAGAKVLDFGVATRLEELVPVGAEHSEADVLGERVLVGTPSYMSPEQALGKPLDERSDLFSFGAVVYEMTSRKRAFEGDTLNSTLLSLVTAQPRPLRDLNPVAPRELDGFIRRCLEKEPQHRFSSATEALAALMQIRESIAARYRKPKQLAAVIAAVAVGALGFSVWRAQQQGVRQAQHLNLRRLSGTDVATSIALSPDGSKAVYSSDRAGNLDLWLENVDGSERRQLTFDPAAETDPAFSPDGKSIAFRSARENGGIYVLNGFESQPRLLAHYGRRPKYSPDGKWIAYWVGENTAGDLLRVNAAKVFMVPAAGGTPRQMASDLNMAKNPIFSPDGKHLLVLGLKASQMDYFLVDCKTGKSKRLRLLEKLHRPNFEGPAIYAWTKSGIFFSAGKVGSFNIYYVPAKGTDFEIHGSPRHLIPGASNVSDIAVAGRTIAFFSGEQHDGIRVLPVDTNAGRASGPLLRVPISDNAARPNLSLDGNLLAVALRVNNKMLIYVRDLRTGQERLVATTDYFGATPRFLPDSDHLVVQVGEGQYRPLIVSSYRTGETREVKRGAAFASHVAFGRWFPYWVRSQSEGNAIWVSDLETGQAGKVLDDGQSQLYVPHISPDARWIAFLAREGPEHRQVFIAPFRGLTPVSRSEWIPVTGSNSGDNKPEWSPNGRLLYFVSERDGYRCIWAQRLARKDKHPLGNPFPVQHFHDLQASLSYANLGQLELSVAKDKIAVLVAEQNGSVWVANLPNTVP